ncbi:hypothetical protein EV201_1425 [Ancylomarina subtilis]|uniref:Lipoprotein n=1 Tax=Ancylomarina subtilis TaxID=1639035 RepID=A0A4V2FT54_9BACT|nr:hypothetical protein [Ancylomarina subtilis]RZT96775.1 hypothetical protein EV201_1425 [Ancylomarina subtilis]
MKKIKFLFVALLCVSIALVSCQKDDSKSNKEEPGKIPGMGNAGGKLEVVAPFVLPDGISLVGEIRGSSEDPGVGNNRPYGMDVIKLKSDYIPTLGSGGQWLALDLIFANATSVNQDVVIPAGCVFEAQEDGYQHGIALQDVRIHVLGNDQIQIKLYLYCINKGMEGSSSVVTYVVRGVSTSEWIMKLTEALEYKMIDVSEFSPEEMDEYNRITNAIQDILWGITNGYGVNDRDWDFINALRDKINDVSP